MARTIRASAFREISGSDRAISLRAALLTCTLLVAVPTIGRGDPLPTGAAVVSGQPFSRSKKVNAALSSTLLQMCSGTHSGP